MLCKASFLAFSSAWLLCTVPATAAPPAPPLMQEAMTDYKSGHYAIALQKFDQLEKQYPNSPIVHYYAGLCKQSMGQITDAKNEYSWVSEHGDSQLKSLASAGLAHLGKYSTSVAGNASEAQPAPASKGDKTDKPMAKVASSAGAAAGASKVKTIYAFVTSWDRNCAIFQPVFDDTKSQFKDIQFVKVDAEASVDLAKKYNVSSYPTLVYLDANQKVLENSTGAPSGTDDFAAKIKSLNEKK